MPRRVYKRMTDKDKVLKEIARLLTAVRKKELQLNEDDTDEGIQLFECDGYKNALSDIESFVRSNL
jgi:hypothetical protein